METVQKKKRRRLRRLKLTKKDKKLAIRILMAFVAIVCGLTSSSYYLNFKKEKQEIADRAASLGLTRNIVQTEDEDILAANYGKDSYTKIGENVYIVNYDSYDEAKKAGSDSGKRTEGVMSEMDTLFVTANDDYVSEDEYPSTMLDENGNIVNDDGTDPDSALQKAYAEGKPEVIYDNEIEEPVATASDDSAYVVSSLPEGYTARQYADETGTKLVAVIDTGANVGAVQSVNFTSSEKDGDENGHGTSMVKKIMDNADGKATIVSLKAINDDGRGLLTDVYQAVRWAIDNNVDVINMSICAYDDGNQEIFKEIIREAISKGITVVASAGNYNSNVKSYVPANIDGVITVGAYKENEDGSAEKADFSNYGDITYYEKENSTSDATATITGMIVAGKDLSNEKTKDNVKVDMDKVSKEDVNISDVEIENPNQWAGVKIVSGSGTAEGGFDYSPGGLSVRVTSRGDYAWVQANNVGDGYVNTWFQLWCAPDNGYRYDSTWVGGSLLNYANAEGYCENNTGWHTSSHFAVVPAGNTTFDVYFAETRVTVNNNGGTNGTCANGTYSSGGKDATRNLGTPTRAGYIFAGWSVSGGGHMDGTWYNFGTSDATVTAQWYGAEKDASTVTKTSPDASVIEDFMYDSKTSTTTYTSFDLSKDGSMWGMSQAQAFSSVQNTSNGFKFNFTGVGGGEKLFVPFNTTAGQKYYYTITVKQPSGIQLAYENGIWLEFLKSKPRTGLEAYKLENGGDVWDTDRLLQTTNSISTEGQPFKNYTNATYTGSFTATTDKTYAGLYFWYVKDGIQYTFESDDFLITTEPNPHTLSTPSSRAGYEFLNWNTKQDGTGTKLKAGDKVNLKTTDTTYYAQWKPLITESPLNVNLGTWNGSSYTYAKNANGMYNNKEADSQKGYKVATVDYKAIFDGNSAYTTKTSISENKTKVLIDSTVNISNLTMMNGYKFEAWEGSGATSNTNTSFKVTPPDSSGNSTNETTLKARGVSYNVVFHNNSVKGVNGTPDDDQTVLATGSMATQTMHYGAKETLAKNQFSWEGHTFLGWSTLENGTSVSSYNGITFTDGASGFFDGMGKLVNVHDDGATVHLYAVWSTEKTTVTIDPTHGTYAGTANKTTKTQKWGTTLTVSNATANNVSSVLTYNFNADGVTWSGTQPTGVSSSALNSKTDTSRLEFSNWIIKDKATGIEVSENNGSWGYLRDPNTYVFGAFDATIEGRYYFSRVILPVPERANYTFAGWYYDADCTQFAGNGGSEYRADDTENSKRYTLYARWEKNTYNYTDTMDYNIVDETIQENHDYPEFKIRKTDELGNVLTTVRTASGETKSFVIEITAGNTYNHNDLVYTLDTGKGILDKSGNVVISNSSSKYNKDAGWYDMTDMLPKGKYTAHEVSAPAGWYMDADQTFEVTGTKADYDNAIAELNSAKKNLDDVTIQNDAQALKKAQERFEKAEANVNYLKSGYNHVTFKDKEIFIINPGYVSWKHDSQGRPIANATFNLIDNTDGNKIIRAFVTNKEGNLPARVTKYLVAGHKMTLEEANVPEGYQKVSTTFTVPTEPQEDLSFINDVEEPSNTAELKVKKTDQDGTVLQGAGFKLYVKTTEGDIVEARYDKTTGKFIQPGTADYDSDKAIAYEGETGADGTVSFKNLPTRATFDGQSEVGTKKYYIQETKAPAGYKLNASLVEVLLEDQNNTIQTFTITDAKATLDVLQTGGSGSSPYIFAGVLLIVLGITLSSLKKQHFIE